LKGLAQDMAGLQKQYLNSGDTVSSENLAQTGLGLADRFISGDGGRFVIGQLVGIAMERIALQSLDQNTSYDFLGGKTAAQRTEELKQRKLEFHALSESLTLAMLKMTAEERMSYSERVKVYGEVAAMRWLQQRNAARTPQGVQ
jgi:hypothetical protein